MRSLAPPYASGNDSPRACADLQFRKSGIGIERIPSGALPVVAGDMPSPSLQRSLEQDATIALGQSVARAVWRERRLPPSRPQMVLPMAHPTAIRDHDDRPKLDLG